MSGGVGEQISNIWEDDWFQGRFFPHRLNFNDLFLSTTNMSNFSFCHNDFKSRLLQGRQKASVCGKGLKDQKGILGHEMCTISKAVTFWFLIFSASSSTEKR